MTEHTKEPDFVDDFVEVIHLAVKLKEAMKRKDKRQGWTKCPRCGGKINAVLAGRKDHIHMACETENCIRMME